MNALTICQPYAHLIVTGQQLAEFRTWSTTYRGPLAIHAGLSKSWLDPDDRYDPTMTFGAVVGIAKLTECETSGDGDWDWLLDDVRRLVTPIPYKGQRGLFDIPDELLAGIRFADEA